jgi:VanZ family protein
MLQPLLTRYSLLPHWVRWLTALALLACTTWLLVLPGSAFPKEDWLDKVYADKWVHIFLMGALSLLWMLALTNSRTAGLSRKIVLIAIGITCYGLGMEFVQKYLVVNRSFDMGDVVADAIGAFLPLVVIRRRAK